jgi:hypothetical protein
VQTRQELRGKHGKNLVLVYCYAPKEVKWDNESVDYDIARHVADRLRENKIKVVDTDHLFAWLDNNDKWRKTAELGKQFKVDYVVHIDTKDYTLFDRSSASHYRGQADIVVNVVKMNDNKTDGHVIYTAPVKYVFPARGPRDSSEIPFGEFKNHFLAALSEEIGRLFYSKQTGDEIPFGFLP